MSRNNKRPITSLKSWCWWRWIDLSAQDDWIARLEATGCSTWTATTRPENSRLLLAVYSPKRTDVAPLKDKFGGQLRAISPSEWLPTRPSPPTRIGPKLEIIHDEPARRKNPATTTLCIPHGIAFGSGEHGTTFMLLRALTKAGDLSHVRILDLGTGSGVLALAARQLGARKIVATDFDPDSVRTARQNEALNFSTLSILWRQADVRKLRAVSQYQLVLANLFSGILCEAATRIANSIAPGGQLWLSGILKSQQKEVASAYRAQGLKLIRSEKRGKWVMLQLARRPTKRPAAK